MSFSKAKIQRFNDVPNEAPPPGAYDPKFDTKGKGFAIEKTGRFNDNKSVASSGPECSKSVSSRGKVPLISPKFRTPQLLKKRLAKVLPTSCPKAKTKLNLNPNPKESKYDARDELADLKVECVNKDKTIQDLEKCMDEMRNEVKRLEKLSAEEEQRIRDVEEQHKKDLESMANLQQDILNSHDQKHQIELTFLRTQLLEALESKENEYSVREKIEKDLKSRITEVSMRCELLETELNNEKKKTKEYDELYEKFQRLEREMESREREFIEQLNEMEINKEIIVSELTDNIMDNEKKLIESREEMKQLKLTINGLTEDLQSSQNNNEFLQTECERLHEEIELSKNTQKKTEEILETRQQIIFNLQSQLSSLQCEIDEIKSDNERITSDCDHKISELISSHAAEITELTTDFITEKHKFEDEKALKTSKYSNIERKNEELLTKNNALISELRDLKKKYDDLKLSYREVENELDNEREFSDILEDNHREEMRKLREQMDSKRSSKNSEKKSKSPDISKTSNLEDQLLERDDKILELTTALEELKITSATQESFSQSLQEELDRAEAELVNKKKELKDLKEQIREETAEMVTRRRRFDVVMAENQATVAALAERLAESNEEVERLQNELKSAEELIVEQRDLLSSITDSSKFVSEQMLTLVEQIDTKELLDNLEKANLSEIERIKVLFEEKIDELKNLSQREIDWLRRQVEEREREKVELQKEIEGMAGKLDEIQGILLGLEEQNDAQCIEVSELQLSKAKVEQKLKDHVEEAEEMKKSLEAEVEKYKDEVEVLRKEQAKYEEQKVLLDEQMEFRRNAEKETQRLVESCERLKKNHQEVTEKYNEIIGHQNHKQRLKHLNQLNEKIVGLEKSLEEKCCFIEQQGKIIERLQADERRRTFTKGKENFTNISKSPFSTPVSSPHKPLTPLRERNE